MKKFVWFLIAAMAFMPALLLACGYDGSISGDSGSKCLADAAATPSLQGYKQLAPDKIPGNIIKMVNDEWMLITAGTGEQFNMMTASWGGLGVLYGKPVAFCFINPLRYTYQLMEKGDTYTLSFYTEAYRDALQYCGTHSGRDADKVKGSGLTPIDMPSGGKAFSEAWLIIECRKLVGQSLNHESIFDNKIKSDWADKQLHKMYIGEIINVWMK
ncbi:MAG: flavin reductase [Tannerella sp.]|jgi:flavin reductase (DIM6/NTAB) family NADH-FMN oxidoreductase RutF|nr:flavin reductase [Tannerella sp.]